VALESLRELYDERMADDKKAATESDEAEPESDGDGDGGDDDKKAPAAGDDDDERVEHVDLSDDDNEMLDAVWDEIAKRKQE